MGRLEDIAANGLPPVEDCTLWEELREARLASQPPGRRLVPPQHPP
ncbi:hypothetical protein ACFP51_17355 [Streptomyces pratens]|uniref:Uncharacterized protein n=1 Tax=Streptomyces pratens TaxID=887456 RepID=A0ABW1LW03_9ACTN